MPKRVQFADEIEPLVQFIEDTDPSEIVPGTLARLRAGVPPQTMLTASALAVTRSSDLPPVITAVHCIPWPASMPCRISLSVGGRAAVCARPATRRAR